MVERLHNSDIFLVEQRAQYQTILQNLGHGSPGDIETALAEREIVESEPGLDLEAVARVQARIETSKQSE